MASRTRGLSSMALRPLGGCSNRRSRAARSSSFVATPVLPRVGAVCLLAMLLWVLGGASVQAANRPGDAVSQGPAAPTARAADGYDDAERNPRLTAPGERRCDELTQGSERVRVFERKASCRTARRLIRRILNHSSQVAPWKCFSAGIDTMCGWRKLVEWSRQLHLRHIRAVSLDPHF